MKRDAYKKLVTLGLFSSNVKWVHYIMYFRNINNKNNVSTEGAMQTCLSQLSTTNIIQLEQKYHHIIELKIIISPVFGPI